MMQLMYGLASLRFAVNNLELQKTVIISNDVVLPWVTNLQMYSNFFQQMALDVDLKYLYKIN